jgi:pentatricopeptide repeat protein
VFDQLLHKDDVACGLIISAYAHHGYGVLVIELFFELKQCGLNMGKASILGVMKACSHDTISKNFGHIIHSFSVQCGFDLDLEIGNSTIHLYAKHGVLLDAHNVFSRLVNRDVISWGALLSGYVDSEPCSSSALELYGKMLGNGIEPSKVIFLCILKACSNRNGLIEGRLVHTHIVICALESDVTLASSLIGMYGKCYSLDEGYEVFRKLNNCNTMTWGALISGHIQNEKYALALTLVRKMHIEGITPSVILSADTMKACACTGEQQFGRLEHHRLIESGVLPDMILTSAMVDMYAKCRGLKDAEKLFHNFPDRNIIAWSSMIWGHVEHGNSVQALDLFQGMINSGIFPDKVICLCVLKAWGDIGAIGEGQWMHDQVVAADLDSDVAVGTAIIDMYAKSGHLEEARCVCDRLNNRNVLSWGALIAGYAQHGSLHGAAESLCIMVTQGLKPNDVIFSSILVACCHSGLLEDGHRFFRLMIEHYNIAPCIDHYGCMLDLLSRSGYLNEASGFIQGIPMPPNVVMLTSLLNSCLVHNQADLGRQHFEHIVQIKVQDAFRI